MKFSEIKYERPDVEAYKKGMLDPIKRLQDAESFEEADKVFLEADEFGKHFESMVTVCSIRHSIDTRDKFYDEEMKYWDSILPELEEYGQQWTMALLGSPFKKEFSEKYGDLMFVDAEMALKSFSPEIIGEMQKENDLVTAYGKLIASAQIPFEDGTYTLSQLSPFKTDANDERRLHLF